MEAKVALGVLCTCVPAVTAEHHDVADLKHEINSTTALAFGKENQLSAWHDGGDMMDALEDLWNILREQGHRPIYYVCVMRLKAV